MPLTFEDATAELLPSATKELLTLWGFLYHLGLVADPKDSAIVDFASANGVATPVNLEGAGALIALMRQVATRGGVDWRKHHEPRVCVLTALARVAVELRILLYPSQLSARSFTYFGAGRWWEMPIDCMDALIRILGAEIRVAKIARTSQFQAAAE
jgi:hypothetical protein